MKRKEKQIQFQAGKFISGRRQKENIWNVFLFPAYLSGVCGILYTFPFFQNVTCNQRLVYLTGIVVSLFFWTFQRRNQWKVALCFFGIFSFWFYTQKTVLFFQGEQIMKALSVHGALSKNQDFTQSLQFFAIFLSIFIFLLVWKFGVGWIFYFYSLPLIFVGPWIGVHFDEKGIILLLLFHMGSSISGKMMFDRKRIDARFFCVYQWKTAGSTLCFLSLLFLAALFLSHKIPDIYIGKLITTSQSVQNRMKKQGMNFLGIEEDHGKINRGNQYTDHEKQLEVVLEKKPKHALYLKNYTGGKYNEDGRWEKVDESDFYKTYKEENNNVIGKSIFENQSLYLAQYDQQVFSNIKSCSIKIKNKRSEHYIPYMEGYIGSTNRGDKAKLYEKKDVLRVVNDVAFESQQVMDRMMDQEEAYKTYQRLHYLYAPQQRFPKLTMLCREHPMDAQEDTEGAVTKFIKKELRQRASYTLTPGTIPLNKEIPEYFLFEGKKGYCQHFATTAALMYRMYYIPSRYASGYRADVTDFKQQSDGTWKAILTEDDAHAWVEIYDQFWGWKVIEVTPGAGRTTQQRSKIQKQTRKQTSDFSKNKIIKKKEEKKTFDFFVMVRMILWIVLWLLFLPMLFCVFWCYRRKKLGQLREASADCLFAQLMKLLKKAGFMEKFDGNENDFAEVFSKNLCAITTEEARRMMELVRKESFGGKHLKKEEQEEVFMIYQKAGEELLNHMKFYQRWYVRYWKVYL